MNTANRIREHQLVFHGGIELERLTLSSMAKSRYIIAKQNCLITEVRRIGGPRRATGRFSFPGVEGQWQEVKREEAARKRRRRKSR